MPPSRNSKHNHHVAHVPDFILESFLGQAFYYAFRSRIAFYPEEQPDFQVPEKYLKSKATASQKKSESEAPAVVVPDSAEQPSPTSSSSTSADPQPHAEGGRGSDMTLVEQQSSRERRYNDAQEKHQRLRADAEAKGQTVDPESQLNAEEKELLGLKSDSEKQKAAQEEENPNLVTWYGDDDPANPMNWSLLKKVSVTAMICLLTFSIYIGSAIYSPGYPSITREFGISQVAASLGLSLFVMGYAVGPLFLSAASEIPQIGRNPPYIITLAIFVVLQVPTALCDNLGALLPLRFVAGFIGSPALATGGASLADMYGPKTRPVAIGAWGLAAVNGPTLGPLIGGFAIQAYDWRWAFWILLWLDGFCLAMLIWAMPETSSLNILTRRARRLRKVTGNNNLKSEGEIVGEQMKPMDIVNMSLIMPFWLSFREPICLALNMYIGLIYAILYCFIESFSLVFVEIYGFNLGQNGLAYMGLFVFAVLTYFGFIFYNFLGLVPIIRRQNGILKPEQRLPLACFGSFFLPISLFWFGWTSTPSVHWMVPIVGSGFFSVGTFLLFQAILNYLADAYPAKAASVLAGNDFIRSSMGAAFPLFSSAMFRNLGHHVAWGSTLLGCLTVLFVPIPFILYRYGRQLRMRSSYARHDI